MTRDDQTSIPTAFVRGGSSKALFFHEHNIPPPGPLRDSVLKRAMGTPDPIQIDGMGGTKAVTSKIAILQRSSRPGIDVDYTFAQVGVKDDTIGYKANCGNISAGVGPFAIDEGLLKGFRKGRSIEPNIETQEVSIYNTNTDKVLIAHVPIDLCGKSVVEGDFTIAAVPGLGAPILLDYRETVGASHNKGLLPTGNACDMVKIDNRSLKITICDIANILVFANAKDFGITGYESAASLTGNAELISKVKELRGKAAQLVGMCQDWQKVDEQSPFIPMPVLIASPPVGLHPPSHLSARLFLDNMCHESMAGTGSVCLAAASRIPSSVVHDQIGEKAAWEGTLKISHPLGIMPVAVEVSQESKDILNPQFNTLSFIRTSRRLMDGNVYIPKTVWDPTVGQTNIPSKNIGDQGQKAVVNGLDSGEVSGAESKRPNASATTIRSNDGESDVLVTEIFARWIYNASTHILSSKLRTKLKEVIIDYIGVTASGSITAPSSEPILQAMLNLGAANGTSTVLTRGRRFTPQHAALLNAAFGHSLDFDDTYAEGTLHAGVTVISAAFAQAELMDCCDSDHLLAAIAVGYEVVCRLGRELGFEAYAQGMHNTSTAGIFGAVASIAVLKRLSIPTIENAFGLAGSKAAGSMQYLENGAWNKRLHPGFAAHDAFVCVALAEAGVLGAAKPVEGKFGFLNGYSPRKDKDLSLLTANLGSDWVWLASSLKPFPACRMTHGFIEMAAAMGNSRSPERRHAGEIKTVTLTMTPANFPVVGEPVANKLKPANIVDAQFSAYYQTANAWLYGSHSGAKTYDRLADPEIHRIIEKTTVMSDPNYKAMNSGIRIEYGDGTIEQGFMPELLGETSHPFTRDQVEAKFMSLMSPIYGRDIAERARAMVDDIERHQVGELLRLLAESSTV